MANNRFEHFQEQFETALQNDLIGFTVLQAFDENKWDSYKFPYVYCLQAGEVKTAETDEGGMPIEPYLVQREFVMSIGYTAPKSTANPRALEAEGWRVLDLVERTIRGVLMDEFEDGTERAIPKISYPTASAQDIDRTTDTKAILLIRGIIVYDLYTY